MSFVEARATVLRKLRGSRGYTQSDIARESGLTGTGGRVTIARIEAGLQEPSADRMQALAHALGVTVADIEAQAAALLLESAAARSPSKVRAATLGMLGGAEVRANEERRQEIADRTATLRNLVSAEVQRAEHVREQGRRVLIEPAIALLGRIESIPYEPIGDIDGEALPSSEDTQLGIDRIVTGVRRVLLGTMATAAAGAGVGSTIGGATAASTYAAVGAFATASTGSAIATLARVATSSATLAWLGGGSLAAGGFGVAGGTLVVSGLVAAPILLATGSLLVWKGRALRRQASGDKERLDAAEAELAKLEPSIERSGRWSKQQCFLLQQFIGEGEMLIKNDLSRRLPGTDSVSWRSLTPADQMSVRVLVDIVAEFVALQSLPVWAVEGTNDELLAIAVEGEDSPRPLLVTKQIDWIVTALERAEDRLESLTSGGR